MANLATLTELAVRLGRIDADALSTQQQAQGTQLLGTATDLILEAVNRDTDWLDDLDPVPRVLRAVCIEVAARVMTNPAGVRTEGETLGQHQHSVSYAEGAGLLYLTDRELRLCRRVALGAGSGSAVLESLATTIAAVTPEPMTGYPIDTNPSIYEDA